MIDIHAKNNVEWTETHVDLFTKNNITNFTNVLIGCKYLKFPSSEEIAKSEKELMILDKKKNKFIYNPHKK